MTLADVAPVVVQQSDNTGTYASIAISGITAIATVAVAWITNRSRNSVQRVEQKMDQVHTLVNSNMTSALENELESRRQSLALLMAAVGHEEPSPEITAAIGSARDRIKILEAQLIARYAADKAAQADRESGQVKTVAAGAADAITSDTKVP